MIAKKIHAFAVLVMPIGLLFGCRSPNLATQCYQLQELVIQTTSFQTSANLDEQAQLAQAKNTLIEQLQTLEVLDDELKIHRTQLISLLKQSSQLELDYTKSMDDSRAIQFSSQNHDARQAITQKRMKVYREILDQRQTISKSCNRIR